MPEISAQSAIDALDILAALAHTPEKVQISYLRVMRVPRVLSETAEIIESSRYSRNPWRELSPRVAIPSHFSRLSELWVMAPGTFGRALDAPTKTLDSLTETSEESPSKLSILVLNAEEY